ncbi:Uncharacterised protein [Candidatus Bilamarchaeum dharawalense]|uniref:DUF424 domain-containing protein n=1 Tax=Candidatus Bilamarchaeum dharawalense TaxID=2885759 RepID=A0A5E4LPC2_9ARCH|nr:Uncharacterised protein [Candidatus Bilamarchaeum dharawalense]
MSLYLKVHENKEGRVIAVCDGDLIGKVLTDGNAHMDLDRYRGFYVGKEVEDGEVKKELTTFSSINMVGKHAVGIALEMGLANKQDVMYIKNIPYIQIYKI